MKGYLTLCGGGRVELPELLQWSIRVTDGDPCGSFSVRFRHTAAWLPVLEQAVRFAAEDGGGTVFSGVVDDFEVRLSEKGLLAEVSGRSMAALLMDNQVRAAEFVSAQLEDILRLYVRPYGVARIDAQAMRPVAGFTVETGYSCWQVLTGFCRHSADIFPRFLPDGTLVLRKDGGARRVQIRQEQVLLCSYAQNRYGAAARQVMVNTRNGAQQVAENAALLALGGSCTHVSGRAGSKVRATWRTAQQRLDDSARALRTVQVRLLGAEAVRPLDLVALDMPAMGLAGEFTVQAAVRSGDDTGVYTTLELRR